jgi:hypothetical protein
MYRFGFVASATLLGFVMSAAAQAESKSVGGSTLCQRDGTRPGCEAPVAAAGSATPFVMPVRQGFCIGDPMRPACQKPGDPVAAAIAPSQAMLVYEGNCVTDRTRPSCENRQVSSTVFLSRSSSNNYRGNAAVGGVAAGFAAGTSYGVYYCIPTMWVPGAYGACVGASALIGTAVGGVAGAVIELDKAVRANPPANP